MTGLEDTIKKFTKAMNSLGDQIWKLEKTISEKVHNDSCTCIICHPAFFVSSGFDRERAELKADIADSNADTTYNVKFRCSSGGEFRGLQANGGPRHGRVETGAVANNPRSANEHGSTGGAGKEVKAQEDQGKDCSNSASDNPACEQREHADVSAVDGSASVLAYKELESQVARIPFLQAVIDGHVANYDRIRKIADEQSGYIVKVNTELAALKKFSDELTVKYVQVSALRENAVKDKGFLQKQGAELRRENHLLKKEIAELKPSKRCWTFGS